MKLYEFLVLTSKKIKFKLML